MSGQQINTSTHSRTHLVQRAAVEHLPKAPFLLRSAPHHLPEPTISAKDERELIRTPLLRRRCTGFASHCMDLGLRGRHREGGEEHERTEDEIAVRGGMINKGEPLHITIAGKGVLAIFFCLRQMPCPRQSRPGGPRRRSRAFWTSNGSLK